MILNLFESGLVQPGDSVVAQTERVERAGVLEGRLFHLADVVVVQL
jgi:hypothetical protein